MSFFRGDGGASEDGRDTAAAAEGGAAGATAAAAAAGDGGFAAEQASTEVDTTFDEESEKTLVGVWRGWEEEDGVRVGSVRVVGSVRRGGCASP